MKQLSKHAAKLLSNLQQLTEEDVSLPWLAICVLMTKFCVIIAVGLLLLFMIGIISGFRHEVTIPKLAGGFFILLVWPFGMGFLMGTAIFLSERWRRMVRRLIGKRKKSEQVMRGNRR